MRTASALQESPTELRNPARAGWTLALRGIVLGLAVAGACAAPLDWPQFRGPSGNGVAEDGEIPSEWSATNRLAWKLAVPGPGWSQPVVLSNTVFVTSSVSERTVRPADYARGVADPYTLQGGKATAPGIQVEWKLWAIDLERGRILWDRTVASGSPRYPIHPCNTYASETPAADARGVYVYFGSAGVIAAYTRQGEPLWTRRLGPFRQQENYGTGSSVRLHDGLLYVQCFNEDEAVVVCLDTRNGTERWRAIRDKPGTCWNTPLLWRHGGRTELVVYAQKLITSHDPATGRELWRVDALEMPAMTSAGSDADRFYVGCRDPYRGGPLHAIIPPHEGETGRNSPRRLAACEAWQAPGAAPGMPSPVAVRGCVFILHDTILGGYDAAAGTELFKERLPGFRAVIASPVVVGDKLLILDESGRALVLRAGRSFEILGRSSLEDTFWAAPAAAGNTLVLRGVDFLYCIR